MSREVFLLVMYGVVEKAKQKAPFVSMEIIEPFTLNVVENSSI
jgi:hypothetical protein